MDVTRRSLLFRNDQYKVQAQRIAPPPTADSDDPGEEDVIPPELVKTLDGLFRERLRRSPQAPAYHHYHDNDKSWHIASWADVATDVARWQAGLQRENLKKGDRVAILLPNSREWVTIDQAVLGLGLVVVPLYFNDRADSIAYILADAGATVLFVHTEVQLQTLEKESESLQGLKRIICIQSSGKATFDLPVAYLDDWLPAETIIHEPSHGSDDLASIVYTSGTTGRPKGVMLSHRNMLSNAYSGLDSIMIYPSDHFLSFLPLSHMLERTVGYYLPMMSGASVSFCRAIPLLAEDLIEKRPTAMISVPRIFERIYAKINGQLKERLFISRWLFQLTVYVGWKRFLHRQGRGRASLLLGLWPLLDRLVAKKLRAKLGGRLRCIICGGAPLAFPVARMFVAMGLPIQQGYGLTEASPIISVNTFANNDPASVGPALKDVEIKIGKDKELLVRGPSVMLGYWNNHSATFNTIDRDGWLYTGDQARIEEDRIYIIGRLKEILVMANGEKLPPADLEMAIAEDPLFDQVMVVGDRRPYLCALVVVNPERWTNLAKRNHLDPLDPDSLNNETLKNILLEHIALQLEDFPGYANIYRVTPLLEPWTVENELLTPTLKPKRKKVLQHYEAALEDMYAGHDFDPDD